ncbi:hypothetical protein SAMN06295888_101318 [Desulfonatronum zhilinae]|nr:hypothetical protein SAMN06295888_101318 [Desulfonatronum zhilinae]
MTWMPAFAGMTSLGEHAISVIPAQAGIQGQRQFQSLPGVFEQLQIISFIDDEIFQIIPIELNHVGDRQLTSHLLKSLL